MASVMRLVICFAFVFALASCGSPRVAQVPNLSDEPFGYWVDQGTGVSIDVHRDRTYTICVHQADCEQGVWESLTAETPGKKLTKSQIVLVDVGEKHGYQAIQQADPNIPVFRDGLLFGKNNFLTEGSDICGVSTCSVISDADSLVVIFVKKKDG